ncbi:MAG: ubiquinol-cytochrome c reductase iron-sulfur subunit [Actinomycetota bacterium]|jgi:ubiquinol-cytochrome c reductase iron-sulfur subunit|nr:ubiquinol-cytochrome c reductase iron-sulfur subunit [Actinomycetota bacterium]
MNKERAAAASFVVSLISSVGLIAWYFTGGGPRGEGILLGLALGGMGLGVVIWAVFLMHSPTETEERPPLAEDAERATGAPEVTRRTLLVRLLGAAGVALGGGIAVPALSLGPRPGQSLFKTAWTTGARLVDRDGNLVRAADIGLREVLTVFPEGHAGSADSQTLIVKVDPATLDLPEGRDDWTPEGLVAYSKICTHAGCPVGLYRSESHELLCPCHQSTFDVLKGAEPTFGPAARALPQLPLAIDENGYVVAQADFSEPVGPSFWNMT